MSLGFWCELHWTYGLLIGSIAIFSMLILPIHEHGRSFHFLLSFRWCLSSVICSFPCRGHLHSLLSLFLGIWFLFEAIINGIVFPHYFLKLFIVDVQKGYWSCKLILYPPTLLKLFMVSRSFWAEFFQSLKYRIMLSTETIWLFLYLFIFLFLALLLWLRIPGQCWVRVRKVGIFVLFLI
jgi:hypothetical protein